VVADDDLLLREGLASLLDRSGYAVLGQGSSALELLELVRTHEPELAIVDIRMPYATEGLDAARVIRTDFPGMAILVLSAYVEADAIDLLRSGPHSGYLLKQRVLDVDTFLEALDQIVAGGSVVEPALVQELASRRRLHCPLAELSARERDVLELMAEGRSNAGIADRLGVAKATVERYVHSVLVKLTPTEAPYDHGRIRAVLAFLEAQEPPRPRAAGADR
jgi:DNA-binding NarL/FixJ family response regulator